MTGEEAIEWLEELKVKIDIPKAAISQRKKNKALDLAISTLKQQSKWISVSEKVPENNGTYLVTLKYFNHNSIDIMSYAENLSKIDEFDFCGVNRAGWYDYDSECGYYEVDRVIAWMPLPSMYEEKEND